MKPLLASLLVALSITAANFAHAGQTVIYRFTGAADGTVAGTGFTAQTYTFTVTGDSAAVQNSSPPYSNVLTGGSIAITGTACAGGCTITGPSGYIVFNTAGVFPLVHGISLVGNLDVNGETLIEGCYACGPSLNDNLVTPVPPTPSGAEGAEAPYVSFATSGGNVQITHLDSHITYSVSLASAPIPTLSQWGLILLCGLLALGASITLRRRDPYSTH